MHAAHDAILVACPTMQATLGESVEADFVPLETIPADQMQRTEEEIRVSVHACTHACGRRGGYVHTSVSPVHETVCWHVHVFRVAGISAFTKWTASPLQNNRLGKQAALRKHATSHLYVLSVRSRP